ncbi:UBA/TS-N domain protein [Teladorsagia circumcincta]|uniref:UBA/TS-N domain protein n=2 Tax=Teladorsagia circumcincta TaxID=45464 RepID=A0A2G9U6P2_TELCI|nr:UBA/TS-N domain protein [Teladorsagia circumcincta]
MENPAQRAHIYFKAKPLVDQYTKDPKDFEAFVRVYEQMIQDEMEKARLMADPASAEGQRLIQEQIQLENINYSYAQALEHTPEAYIPVHMLYIRMEINGHPVKAFVDSGQVKVMDHYFPCNFDVMADREMDLLLGLNILKRHQCNLNLKTNMLEMGDGTKTPFLSEAEINTHLEDLASSNPTDFVVDDDLLMQAKNLGFSEADARAALEMTRNDLEAALQHLFSKADERSNAMEQ